MPRCWVVREGEPIADGNVTTLITTHKAVICKVCWHPGGSLVRFREPGPIFGTVTMFSSSLRTMQLLEPRPVQEERPQLGLVTEP